VLSLVSPLSNIFTDTPARKHVRIVVIPDPGKYSRSRSVAMNSSCSAGSSTYCFAFLRRRNAEMKRAHDVEGRHDPDTPRLADERRRLDLLEGSKTIYHSSFDSDQVCPSRKLCGSIPVSHDSRTLASPATPTSIAFS
jgi:hypothetical protein